MTIKRFFSPLVVFIFVCSLAAAAQQLPASACGVPSFSSLANKANIFSEEQEGWLGDSIDATLVKQYNLLEDPEGDYLQKFGEHILSQLPPTKLHYTFHLIDLPVNNAFSFGGTRIYVTRQLVAFLHNQDEFAGLLGHELGHLTTHQRAIEATRVFKKVLGVTQLGDRKDVSDKWNQLIDISGKKRVSFGDRSEVEEDQLIADRTGLFVMMRAGYEPRRFAEFWDRLTETKGKTGNFFTDLFGTTTPESKRLRELINKAAPLPQGCVAAVPEDSEKRFEEWQKKVIAARRATEKEQIAGLLSKATLTPPLRGSLEYLQFSGDGKYMLAQDESSIFVLSTKPFDNLFRMDAVQAFTAQFSPDSRSIVFYDSELRVEKWDIESRQRTSIPEITLSERCRHTELASSGDVLACMRLKNGDHELDLIDVNTGASFYTHKMFYNTASADPHMVGLMRAFGFDLEFFEMQFSPDSRYFLVNGNDTDVQAYDLQAHAELKVGGRIKQITRERFAFTPQGNIVGLNPEKPSQSALVRFPSGDLIEEVPLEINGFKLSGRLIAAPKGNYVLVSPAAMWPIAAISLDTKQLAMGYKAPGLAIYDQMLAGEELGGKMTLYNLADKKPLAKVQLPFSPLPNLDASGFSPNGKWLAASGHTSGAVYNAQTGERAVDTGHFTGGFFDQYQLFATFSKLQHPKVAKVDLEQKRQTDLFDIELPGQEQKDRTTHIWQAGDLLFIQPQAKGHFSVEAHDIRTNNIVWKHEFAHAVPVFFYSASGKTLSLLFDLYSNFKDEAKNDPALAERLNNTPDKSYSNLVQVLDPASGKTLGSVVIDTGKLSFFIREAVAAADTVLVYDSRNRTQVYSLKTGAQRGKVEGRFRTISSSGDRMLVETSKGVCDIYDTTTLQSLAHFTLPSRVVHSEFSADGSSIMVLTADQVIYNLKNPGVEQKAQTGN